MTIQRVLLDTNVLIDLFASREPWFAEASQIWDQNNRGSLSCYVTASSLTDISFLCERIQNTQSARRAVELCLGHFEICPVSRFELEQAAGLVGKDFEDNLQIICAMENGLDAIVTRDKDGFIGAALPVLSPAEALAGISNS